MACRPETEDAPPVSRPLPLPLPERRRLLIRGAAALAALPTLPTLLHAQPLPKPAAGGYAELRWDALVPKGWDPMQGLKDKGMNPANLMDGDPKAMAMMQELRDSWDKAPTEGSLDGNRIKLPGYIVPLDEVKAGLKEFLLVPYFGACIHTPPPPANQIVWVVPAKPAPLRISRRRRWDGGDKGDTVKTSSGSRRQAIGQ